MTNSWIRATLALALCTACGGPSAAPNTTMTVSGRATRTEPGRVDLAATGSLSATATWTVINPGSNPPPRVLVSVSWGSDTNRFGNAVTVAPATLATSVDCSPCRLYVNVDPDDLASRAVVDYVLTVSYPKR